MHLLKRLITSPHIRHIVKYRQVVGIFLLVTGLVLTVSGGMQYAFFEKPALQQKVLAAFVPTDTPVEATPKIEPTVVPQVTFGPPLPATTTASPTPSTPQNPPTTSDTPTLTLTPTALSSLTPTPTQALTLTPTPTKTPAKQITASILTTLTVMVTVTPTETMTPTPTSDTSSSDDAIWDKLAKCESNNHWNDDTGNGYYGGLQFGQGTWESVGGTGNPANASREEQILRGKILQARRGWGPWGGCGKMLGLL